MGSKMEFSELIDISILHCHLQTPYLENSQVIGQNDLVQ